MPFSARPPASVVFLVSLLVFGQTLTAHAARGEGAIGSAVTLPPCPYQVTFPEIPSVKHRQDGQASIATLDADDRSLSVLCQRVRLATTAQDQEALLRILLEGFALGLKEANITSEPEQASAARSRLRGWRERAGARESIDLTAIRGEDWLLLVEDRSTSARADDSAMTIKRLK
ncbi:hypothetical protein [Zavarzinia compransoris]|uniref:hypothetical protein n=1 Tax=Zavarzinia compransoris TaxID=1264899 RepID=UPI00105DBC29|nr:hypothetical protein [Zavarzinia compransoris]